MFKPFFLTILAIILVWVGIELALLIKTTKNTVIEYNNTAKELTAIITEVHAYTTGQLDSLESQQRSIKAGIEAAAVFNGTGRLLNKTTIPRINKTLDSFNESVVSLNEMLRDTNASVNEKLLPELTETIRIYGVSAEKFNGAIVSVSQETSLTIKEIRDIIASDEWMEVLKNISSTTKHIDGIADNVEEATDRMPAMAELIEKMMRTTSKYQKALLLSQIFSYVLKIF